MFPLGPLPHISITTHTCGLPCPGEHLRLCPLLCNRCSETKKRNGPNEKTDQRSRKKIQLSNKEIANLSDAQFKTLVIRILTEMTEYGHKVKEEVKAIQSEIKENIQGTNCEGKESKTQINDLGQKEEINIKL